MHVQYPSLLVNVFSILHSKFVYNIDSNFTIIYEAPNPTKAIP